MAGEPVRKCDILGVPVDVVNRQGTLDIIAEWVAAGNTKYVCASDVHSIMQAQKNEKHMRALQNADLVLPDGMPVVWAARSRGEHAISRVCGPDLMLEVSERAAKDGWRIYLYGGKDGVAKQVAKNLTTLHPGLQVVGIQAPPFRPLSEQEVSASLDMIRAAKPDIVWIGLGCPKQEIWMLENAAKIIGSVSIGVGAAFDFYGGQVRRAPLWMRESGFEWAHRLFSEPKRLWRRYLLMAPQFVLRTALETISRRVITSKAGS